MGNFINAIQYSLLTIFIIFGSVFGYLKLTNQTIGFNVTDSLPQTVFLIHKTNEFSKGDFVQFSYKADAENLLPEGARLVKKVVGVPGDTVRFEAGKFFINDVEFGLVKELALTGKPLKQNVSKTLSSDEYFVFTPHVDSFDSRYIHMGYISKSQVFGKAVGGW
ncbi:signal peptidase I [Thiomicrorhabdus aquaedulcis]|uniref:signal peptidase I n=1 Tax=Thiomicrorhabdus aquaedulcis TaxID=2211106 RepID=UPI000FD7B48F|nr:signal peptidase I [Thiomicrorhabdus aquaedulcis]